MRTDTASSVDIQMGDWRLDATYHASPGQRVAKKLAKSGKKLDTLGQVCLPGGIYIPSRFKRIFVDELKYGAPYLTGGSITKAEPHHGAKLLSYRFTTNMEKLALSDKMILITCSGEIGNTVYVNSIFGDTVGSPDLIRILADPSKIHSGYLYAYLSSLIARDLIQQRTYGAVIPHIEAHHVIDLPIPRLGENLETHIHLLIEQSAALLVKAYILLKQAREQLLTINNLNPLTLDDYYFYGNSARSANNTGTFFVSSKDLSILTMNAWNYADKFAKLRQRIMDRSYIKFSDVILPKGYRTGRSFKRVAVKAGDGIEFIGQKDLFGLRKIGKWISRVPIGSLESEIVTDNTILLAGVGTNAETEVFGRCEFVWKNFQNKIPAAEIIRINVDEEKMDAGYLYAFLSSDYGFRFLRSTITGTKLCRFIEPLVMELPIPLPDSMSIMTNIGKMVRKAYEYRSEALDKEVQAQELLGLSG